MGIIYSNIDPDWSCCGPLQIPEYNDLTNSYYEQVETCIEKAFTNAFTNEVYGRDSEYYFNMINDFSYLLLLLWIMKEDRDNYILINGADRTDGLDYYIEAYHIDCIKEYFFCRGCNIETALNVFGFSDLLYNDEGIGFDSINPPDSGERGQEVYS